jgi:hypothetical protein
LHATGLWREVVWRITSRQIKYILVVNRVLEQIRGLLLEGLAM